MVSSIAQGSCCQLTYAVIQPFFCAMIFPLLASLTPSAPGVMLSRGGICGPVTVAVFKTVGGHLSDVFGGFDSHMPLQAYEQ